MLLTRLGYTLRDLTIDAVIRRQAATLPDKTFLTWLPDGRSWTFGNLEATTRRYAHAFRGLGWGKGSHVAILMENSPEHLFVALALARIGAVAVPINTACKGQLLDYYLEQSDSRAVVVDGALLDRVRGCERSRHLADVLVLRPHSETTEHERDLLAVVDAAPDDLPLGTEVSPSDLCSLAYTSGTTGPSKGNMLSQAAALSFGLSNAEHHGYRADDVMYVCLPLFHVNALNAATYAMLLTGASVALTERFSASRFLPEVRRSGATVTNLLGALCNFLWSQPPTADDTSTLRIVSAVPVPRFARAFEKRFGLRITSAYGMSDFGMIAAYTVADPAEKMGSAGQARQHYQIRIADDDDVEVPPGTTGEILVRTTEPWIASTGYYNMPDATLRAHRNLWFHTGDLGYVDEDGFLFFVDRKKDAIRRRGENVSAFEVQQIICLHGKVADAAVFPIRAETSEDEIAAAVIRKDPSLSERELVEFCQDNMAYFMVPRFIEFRDTLPRSVGEKVQKHLLRADLEERLAAVWDREKAGIVVRR